MGLHLNFSKKISLILFVLAFSKFSYGKTKTTQIILADKKIEAEVADTDILRQKGLMYRSKLESNRGMLFVFNNEDYRSFWMKNCLIDLDVAFINTKKEIIDIQTMSVPSLVEKEIPSYKSKFPAQYALEMNKDWFKKNKIKIGQQLKFNLK